MAAEWLKNAVFYEIYPQSWFDTNGGGIGDIPGIIEKLDYVKSVGRNALWLNPWYDSPFMDTGYDVRDYKKVAERCGTNEDAAELFRAYEPVYSFGSASLEAGKLAVGLQTLTIWKPVK